MKRDEEITGIKNGDERVLSHTYQVNRSFFIAWFRKHTRADESLIADWYQEAFFIMYEHIRINKLLNLDSSIGAYLIGVGKNLERDHRKNGWSKNVSPLGDDATMQESIEDSPFDHETAEQLDKALSALGGKCREILIMFYYKRFSMEVIADRAGLKNDQVAKKTKYECLKKLREIYMRNGN